MKLLLIQPPIEDFYQTEIRLQPVGLCYLKAAVRAQLPDVQVVVRDYHHGWGRRTVALPRDLAHLRPYYFLSDRSPFSLFDQFYRFGATDAQITADVAEFAPDMVGISCLFSPYHREALHCADVIRQTVGPDMPIVLGGHHVSAMPKQVLAHPSVDFVVCGEGEGPLTALVQAFLTDRDYARVNGIGFKRYHATRCRDDISDPGDLHAVFTAPAARIDIEQLPLPDLSDFEPSRYTLDGRPLAVVISSRGCPQRCDFCAVQTTFGHRFRVMSVDAVMHELNTRYQQGYRVFDFEDDNLTVDRARACTLFKRIAATFDPSDIELVAMNGLSYLSLDAELLQLMRRAGFRRLNIALVSTSDAVCRDFHRTHHLDTYLRVVQDAFALGFAITSYQILGLPGEALDSMIDTLVFAAQLPVLLGASPFYLTPGSPLSADQQSFDNAQLAQARLTNLGCSEDPAQRDAIFTLLATTRILNFLKGLPIDTPNVALTELLAQKERFDPRTALGCSLLARLLSEGKLYAVTPKGLIARPRFNGALFRHLWDRLDEVRTQAGARIIIAS